MMLCAMPFREAVYRVLSGYVTVVRYSGDLERDSRQQVDAQFLFENSA